MFAPLEGSGRPARGEQLLDRALHARVRSLRQPRDMHALIGKLAVARQIYVGDLEDGNPLVPDVKVVTRHLDEARRRVVRRTAMSWVIGAAIL